MFSDGSFDFVYSFIVFQHIPDRDVVLRYLREAGRVLKPGGILRCQLRGTPPLDSEMKRESSTWTGCHFSADEVAAFARKHHLQLVAISGLQTQYMWVTLRKPLVQQADPDFSHVILPDLSHVILKDVTAVGGGKHSVPQRGREAAVSLWIEGLPETSDLALLAAGFDGVLKQGCYMSPIGENGGCQIDVVLPRGVRTGSVPVTLHNHQGTLLAGPVPIDVTPGPPWEPKVVSVTDGINVQSKRRVETGGVKVTIQDLERPQEVSFLIDGRPVEYLQFECENPITFTYEFAFYPSRKVKNGERRLDISIAGRALAQVSLQLARQT